MANQAKSIEDILSEQINTEEVRTAKLLNDLLVETTRGATMLINMGEMQLAQEGTEDPNIDLIQKRERLAIELDILRLEAQIESVGHGEEDLH